MTLNFFIMALLLEIKGEYTSSKYQGEYSSHNMCGSNPLYDCNTGLGYYAWCADDWDHHCCFRARSPPSNKKKHCDEVTPCLYSCCNSGDTPCGYDSCCESNIGESCRNGICYPTQAPTVPSHTEISLIYYGIGSIVGLCIISILCCAIRYYVYARKTEISDVKRRPTQAVLLEKPINHP